MSAIRLTDLTLGYDRHPAIHHLSGEVATGSLTAIVGPNGAGKSTLLKGITGTLLPLAGGISLAKGKRLAYLPQSAELDRSFPIHVYDLVAMGLWSRAGIFGRIGASVAHKVEHAIAAVELTGFERRPIGTLSGGQMQRALFARLLLQDAEIILLDEPFTAIDARTTADLLALVQRWHGESRTVVAVLHDIETVRRAFPQTLLLAREAVAWGATADVLTPENLLKARRMVEAFDSHAAPCQRDAA
ncbi:ABC transporter ATP-binding protein [Bosea sp. SSUT16]|uniref:ABC transporter ATP-binding protein n=1 Tax=Bosea spartocytisi TaxID=2773451 RepID=A0A927E794_9HYPH|nr:zinc ABC transporter ATP-binding protein AztA [Bosea spartocytisi]MBD3846081.1 ABC transporter ATP-binding protein [Bosea spartocytisi]MCT4473265.1 zinc ABC transporter ATP-binding protein AztA [Bosea spartocytisi]